MPVSQSTQDSHEQDIQKQITTLQEKMRNITYSNEMTSEEKSDQKKALQEKIQNLNSELRQYQIHKRQEEAEKRKEEAARKQQEEAAKTNAEEKTNADADNADVESGEEKIVPFPESNSSKAILSNSNTKEHLASLQKVRNDLAGKLRTATSEKEKAKLRKRINKVSKGIGVKVKTINDTIADGQKDVKPQKNTSNTAKERKEDSANLGKVIITRKRD